MNVYLLIWGLDFEGPMTTDVYKTLKAAEKAAKEKTKGNRWEIIGKTHNGFAMSENIIKAWRNGSETITIEEKEVKE
jgi:hypothetical protein